MIALSMPLSSPASETFPLLVRDDARLCAEDHQRPPDADLVAELERVACRRRACR